MNLRRVSEAAVPIVSIIVAIGLPLVWAGRLPDPVASHWGSGGVPDGALPRTLDALLFAALTAATAIVPLLAARRARARFTAQALVATANGAAWLLAMLRWMALEANLDAAAWSEAAPLGPAGVLGAVASGALLAVWGWWLASDRPDEIRLRNRLAPPVLEPGETAVFSGGATGPIALLLPAVLVAAGASVWAFAPRGSLAPSLLGTLVVTLAAGTLTRVAVTVGPRQLRIRLGWLGLPRINVPLEKITDVRWEDVEPMRYGGWGYRVVPGARAVIVRRGEGLRIGRDGQPDLVVTVDDATTAGGVLLAHLGLGAHGEF